MKLSDLGPGRRRLFTLHARAAALLALGRDRIEDMEKLPLATDDKDEPQRLKDRQRTLWLLRVVRRMANSEAIYEHVNGAAYVVRPPTTTDDTRFRWISRLAKALDVSEATLDAEVARILDAEEHARKRSDKLAETFMAKLPASRPCWKPGPRTHGKTERLVHYDADKLRDVLAVMPPGKLRNAEREMMEEQLLGNLDDHLQGRPAEMRQDTVESRAAMLHAACVLLGDCEAELRRSQGRKSKALLEEFPSGAGDGPRYSARSADIDNELMQPIQESIRRLTNTVIRFAVRVAPADKWPPGNTKLERALALGRGLSVPEADLAVARARLGYAALESEYATFREGHAEKDNRQ